MLNLLLIPNSIVLGTGRCGSASPSGQRGQQGGDSGSSGSSAAEAAYHRMELLSHAIKNELQRDLHIHDSAILPNFVSLPQVCAACPTPPNYCAMSATHVVAGHNLVQLANAIGHRRQVLQPEFSVHIALTSSTYKCPWTRLNAFALAFILWKWLL